MHCPDLAGAEKESLRTLSFRLQQCCARTRRLGIRSPTSRLPKWVSLAPGAHELRFHAGNSIRFSSFEERVTLNDGDVLVAICEPVQPRTFYAPSPEADTWHLGIIDSAGRPRPVRPAER